MLQNKLRCAAKRLVTRPATWPLCCFVWAGCMDPAFKKQKEECYRALAQLKQGAYLNGICILNLSLFISVSQLCCFKVKLKSILSLGLAELRWCGSKLNVLKCFPSDCCSKQLVPLCHKTNKSSHSFILPLPTFWSNCVQYTVTSSVTIVLVDEVRVSEGGA